MKNKTWTLIGGVVLGLALTSAIRLPVYLITGDEIGLLLSTINVALGAGLVALYLRSAFRKLLRALREPREVIVHSADCTVVRPDASQS